MNSTRSNSVVFLLCFLVAIQTALSQTPPATGFIVSAYDVEGNTVLPTNRVNSTLSGFTGTNVSLGEIVKAAEDLQTVFRDEGYPQTSIAIAKEQITNGIVTMNVFQAALPQIVVSGVRYFSPTNNAELPAYAPPVEAVPPLVVATTNAPPPANYTSKPATPEQMASARAALSLEMVELNAEQKDHRIHVVSTKAGPGFDVEQYFVIGNSILPPAIGGTLANIDGAYGTNVSFAGIETVVEQLQEAYHDRGYPTVAVALPQQKLTNATVKVQVLKAGFRRSMSPATTISVPTM